MIQLVHLFLCIELLIYLLMSLVLFLLFLIQHRHVSLLIKLLSGKEPICLFLPLFLFLLYLSDVLQLLLDLLVILSAFFVSQLKLLDQFLIP